MSGIPKRRRGVWRLCLFVVLAGLFLTCRVEAAEPAKDAKGKDTPPAEAPKPQRVLVHIAAPAGLEELAAGLGLLINERLQATPEFVPISRMDVLRQASKAKVLRQGEQIFVRDLAYLALSTEAQRTVLGYLERRMEGLTLDLRAYNPINGAPQAASFVVEDARGADGFMARALEAMAPMFGLAKDYAWPKAESGLSWPALALAGRGLRTAMNPKDKDGLFAGLLFMAQARQRGVALPLWTRDQLARGSWPAEPQRAYMPPEKALLLHLAGETGQALRAYEAFTRGESAKRLAWPHAALLLAARQAPKARARLESIPAAEYTTELNALAAHIFAAISSRAPAAQAAESALKGDSDDEAMPEFIAQQALSRGERQEASKYFALALEMARRNGAWPHLAARSLGWLGQAPSDLLLDALPIETFDENGRERLAAELRGHAFGTPAQLLAEGRLKLASGAPDEAAALLSQAADAAPGSLTAQLSAADFFLKVQPNLDKSLRYYQGALSLAPKDSRALAGQVEALARGEFYDKAQAGLATLAAQLPNTPYLSLRQAELAGLLHNAPQARDLLAALIAKNEDYVPALKAQATLGRNEKDAALEKAAADRLGAYEPSAAPAQGAAAPKPAAPAEAEAKKPARRQPAPTPQFPATALLLKALPEGTTRVALVDLLKAPGWPERPSALTRLGAFFLADGEALGADLARQFEGEVQVERDPSLADELKLIDGVNPFGPESFSALFAKSQADAVLLYGVSAETLPGGGKRIVAYGYKRGGKEILRADGEVNAGGEKLVRFNPLPLLPLLVFAGLIAAFVVLFKRRAFGSVEIALRYDDTLEGGYFAVRLSKRPLKQGFNVDRLMTKRYTDDRADTERKIRAFFSSVSPLRKMATANRADFTRVRPGHYYVYITSVMVNLSTRHPIGNYEVTRELNVRANQRTAMTVNLEVNECYAEVRVVRDVPKKKKVRQLVEGKMQMVEKEFFISEPVAGANVAINDDPTTAQPSLPHAPLTYYFAPGVYRFIATLDDLAAVYDLVVDNTAPKTIELKLQPRAEVQDAMVAPMPEAPLVMQDVPPVAAPAAEDPHIGSQSQLEIQLDGEVLGADLPPLPSQSQSQSAITPIVTSASASSAALSSTASQSLPVFPPKRQPRVRRLRIPGESTIPSAVELDELFETVPAEWSRDGTPGAPLPEGERERALATAKRLRNGGRYEEAAEICIRLGEYDMAAELCQRCSNPALTYKVYGLNYLKQGATREAAEMFRLAEEPLLEANALEGLRLFDEANRKRGAYWEARGDWPKAVEFYGKAASYDKVGEIHERQREFVPAGDAFLRARLYARAAECYLAANEPKRAAEAYEMDAQFLKAAELYRRLGSNAKYFALLERAGRFCEAAEGYKRHGLLEEALRACRQVRPESDEFLKAALLSGTILMERGESEAARGMYRHAIENARLTPETMESVYEFGVLIQEQGLVREAHDLFTRMQAAKPNYADVSIRIQHLGERLARGEAEGVEARKPDAEAPPPALDIPAPSFAASKAPSSNRYVFERELGRGAMGIVYRARDTLLDRVVAYKTVSNAIKENPGALRYFLSEAKSLAALNHPNIVTVYDVGQESESYFITMELVEGRSLADFIRDKGRLTIKNCVVVALKLCAGLEYAHGRGVIHRDIKPSNIMLSNQGEVKLMDFGLAKIVDAAIQDRMVVRGTPLYMAPEQAEGVGVDAQSDLYSFGITLYEMATGVVPFSKGDIAHHHQHTPPPSPLRFNPSIPEALEHVILKCLEKSKAARYQSAKEIKADLAPLRQALLSAQPAAK